LKIKLLVLLCLFSFFVSCDDEEVIYHYNKYDNEYDGLQGIAAEECVENSEVFKYLETTNTFDSANFKVNDIYRVTQEEENSMVLFFKISAISAGSMTIIVNADDSNYDQILTYTETSNDELLDVIKQAACNVKYKDIWNASGFNSEELLSLTWNKETITVEDDDDDADDDPEAYYIGTDSLKFDKDYPLFFYFFNGTKQMRYKLTKESTELTKKSTLTIKKIVDSDDDGSYEDEKECTDYTSCSFSATGSFADCTISIDTTAQTKSEYNSKIISLITNSGTCNLLPSAGGF